MEIPSGQHFVNVKLLIQTHSFYSKNKMVNMCLQSLLRSLPQLFSPTIYIPSFEKLADYLKVKGVILIRYENIKHSKSNKKENLMVKNSVMTAFYISKQVNQFRKKIILLKKCKTKPYNFYAR